MPHWALKSAARRAQPLGPMYPLLIPYVSSHQVEKGCTPKGGQPSGMTIQQLAGADGGDGSGGDGGGGDGVPNTLT